MDCDIVILFGSQTGNAEDLSKRIGLRAKENCYSVSVQAIDSYPLKMLVLQKFIIFVCSTTGHGQAPENMSNFYKFIRRSDLPNNCLSSLSYVVYGLGDSSYAKFNWISKVVFKRLKACGARNLQELIAADEKHPLGCDGAVYPKLDELWSILKETTTKKSIDEGKKSLPIKSSYSMNFVSSDESKRNQNDIYTQEFYQKNRIIIADCISNQRVTTEDHFQDTRLIKFKVKEGETRSFEPGDVCSILPQNSDSNVEEFARLLNLDLNQRFTLTKLDPNYMVDYLYDFIPQKSTIKTLIKYFLDIQSVPKRSFFEYLSKFCNEDDIERDKLKEFASTKGQEEMFDYCVLPKRSILEVLADFPNSVANIKFEYLFDIIPPMKPRSFSIASAYNLHPNEIHLLVGVVKFKTRMKKIRLGLCSNYLASMKESSRDCLRFTLTKTSFKLPTNIETPIIMIGPGLGLAPFRSFMQQRIDIDSANKNYLYFGCRRQDGDFYCEKELTKYSDAKMLVVQVAFSRHTQKQYVQQLIKKDAELIKRLMLEENAIFYVAGNSKLPDELQKVVAEILGYSSSAEELERSMSILESKNKIQYDCW